MRQMSPVIFSHQNRWLASDPGILFRPSCTSKSVTNHRAVPLCSRASGIGPEPHSAIRHADTAVPGIAECTSAAEQEETYMPKISRPFFYLTELPARWGRSLSEIAGWALAGRLNLMVPIAPVQCGTERASGIVRVQAEDVARLFHPDNPIDLSCAVIRILPTVALEPVYVTDPAGGIDVRLRDLMLDAEEVGEFEQLNDLLGIGTRFARKKTGGSVGQGRPAGYEWETMLVDVMIDISENGMPDRQEDFLKLILDWFTENSADGAVPEVSTVRKRYAQIWWRLQDRL